MSAMVVTDLSTHHSSRAGERVKYIVIHTTVSPPNSTPRKTRDYLKTNARKVSIHEYVEAAELVVRMVEDGRAAHHCESDAIRLPGGEPGYLANEITWGIEGYQIAGLNVSQGIAATMLERTIAACRRFGLPASRVYGHREIVTANYRQDPVGVNMGTFRASVALALAPKPPPVEIPKVSIEAAARAAWRVEALARASRGDAGAVEALTLALRADGPQTDVHDALVALALPPLIEARDR